MTIDPTSDNSGVVQLTNSATPFTTDGGRGWAFISTGFSSATGAATFNLGAALNIDQFALNGTDISSAITNLNSNNGSTAGWQFFATVGLSGSGTWTNGVFNTSSVTGTMYLWGVQAGNALQFAGAPGDPATAGSAGFVANPTNFAAVGMSLPGGAAPLSCYTGSGNIGLDGSATGGATNCTLLAKTTVSPVALLPGSFFTVDDSGLESKDNITFNIGFPMDTASWTYGQFWMNPPDPSSFNLVVISGCETGTSSSPVAESIGDPNSPALFFTASAQSGSAPCNPSSGGITNQHDPIGWGFGAQVPEPTGLAILGTGLLGMAWLRRRRTAAA